MIDCVIVGAGPAGATAAYHLAKAGHAVLLLEKQQLPRYKPCGGGVSPQIAQWFDFDLAPAISQTVTHVRYTWKLADAVETELAEPIWMVRRDQFDHFLVKQAQRQGAVLWDGTKATGIEFQSGHWQVKTDRESVQARYLIAADGARGPVAKWLGFRERKITLGGALETEPRLPVQDGHIAHFEFGLLKQGYVWNFPKADGYSIGSGVFRTTQRQSGDLIRPLIDYAAQFAVDASQVIRHGHPICLWNGNQRLHTQNALLVGEAACVVDPFTAEGIRPSIYSGLQAAKAIDAALGGCLDGLERYTQTMSETWGSDMQWALRLAKAFYAAPELGYRIGIKNPKATRLMGQILVGELRYAQVVHHALRHFTAGLCR
jgi:geranylgeranyl reductase family protein